MLDTVSSLPGDHLNLTDHGKAFSRRFATLRDTDVWKLERQQDFHQPESDSWMAFLQERREESLDMLEARRPALLRQFARLAESGCAIRRVRVVERPFTHYLLWELHSLRVRAQCGEDIRVISAEPLAAFERARPVPEILTLGNEVTYRILYDAAGEVEGAAEFADPTLTERCRFEIATLYRGAEVLEDYFVREVSEAAAAHAR